MASNKSKRKSVKNIKEAVKSNPLNRNNDKHLDDEQKQSKVKSKSSLTSSELNALKERGLRVLDEKIKKGLKDSDDGFNNRHLNDEQRESEPKSKSGLTSSQLAILKKVIAEGLTMRAKIAMEEVNRVNGTVIHNYSDGAKYQGGLNNGLKHGRGILISPEGDCYEGQFKNDFAHGEGIYTWADGVRSEGEFREGKPWNVVGYDEHGKICGLIVDGEVDEVYTDSHRCANQRQYKELKERNVNQQQEINHE